ncbi:hypothetical protein KAFR_0J02130 [Kazachstania africana CBS 2517]|uniref:Major facilitator superfamily (MFS) profile domain-containing protein n=1 Tax=Kazachstania africana (strain ATCC 22294 / BCRC 22015 / CBS 2517 / CECT 1963 / NBRC 1671 / NRRL Y-8276) TaxID=1071382 RepID=H2B0X7_KAZAF|nr:hypothetical protein KAFR_0J02130 [Kazachstania africana CBS 2517]CCF60277.1 hypothetical protein KAFR_0J02130 [Kazachstania africana CBS 2517]
MSSRSSIHSSVTSISDEVDSLESHQFQPARSMDNIRPITPNSTGSTGSLQSKAPSLAKTISKRFNELKEAVRDDNQQTDDKYENLEDILVSRFDVGDAIRLRENERELQNEALDSNEPSSEFPSTKEEPQTDSDLEKTSNDLSQLGETIKKVYTNISTGKVELPPDKGYAWVVVFSVWLVMFNTWGCNSAFGIFLSHYLSSDTYPGASKYDYALIAGLTAALGQGLAPIAMYFVRIFGMKPVMGVGTIFLLAGFLLASFNNKLWQLYCCQGLLVGASIAFLFTPATTVLPGWFLKKRALATGISLFGTGAGGVTYALSSNKLIQQYGNTDWCFRMLAICTTTCAIIATILIRQRKPVKPVGLSKTAMIDEFKYLFQWRVMKQPMVILIALWFALALFAYNLMIFTLSSYARARGLSAHQATSLTAILNGSQALGRPIMGLSGDRLGRTNVTIVLTCLLTIYMFAFWIPASTYVQLIFFSILVGVCVGVANVMSTVLTADLVPQDDFLAAWCFVNYFCAPLLLVCEVIAQALTTNDKHNPYLHTQIFAGCCFFGALLLVMALRERAVYTKLSARQKATLERLSDRNDSDSIEEDEEIDWDLLEKRKLKYDFLLGAGVQRYFARLCYPMKV